MYISLYLIPSFQKVIYIIMTLVNVRSITMIVLQDNAKTASYGMVIVVGVGVTGIIAYNVLKVSQKASQVFFI